MPVVGSDTTIKFYSIPLKKKEKPLLGMLLIEPNGNFTSYNATQVEFYELFAQLSENKLSYYDEKSKEILTQSYEELQKKYWFDEKTFLAYQNNKKQEEKEAMEHLANEILQGASDPWNTIENICRALAHFGIFVVFEPLPFAICSQMNTTKVPIYQDYMKQIILNQKIQDKQEQIRLITLEFAYYLLTENKRNYTHQIDEALYYGLVESKELELIRHLIAPTEELKKKIRRYPFQDSNEIAIKLAKEFPLTRTDLVKRVEEVQKTMKQEKQKRK